MSVQPASPIQNIQAIATIANTKTCNLAHNSAKRELRSRIRMLSSMAIPGAKITACQFVELMKATYKQIMAVTINAERMPKCGPPEIGRIVGCDGWFI